MAQLQKNSSRVIFHLNKIFFMLHYWCVSLSNTRNICGIIIFIDSHVYIIVSVGYLYMNFFFWQALSWGNESYYWISELQSQVGAITMLDHLMEWSSIDISILFIFNVFEKLFIFLCRWKHLLSSLILEWCNFFEQKPCRFFTHFVFAILCAFDLV